jgi:hypothetical protein
VRTGITGASFIVARTCAWRTSGFMARSGAADLSV